MPDAPAPNLPVTIPAEPLRYTPAQLWQLIDGEAVVPAMARAPQAAAEPQGTPPPVEMAPEVAVGPLAVPIAAPGETVSPSATQPVAEAPAKPLPKAGARPASAPVAVDISVRRPRRVTPAILPPLRDDAAVAATIEAPVPMTPMTPVVAERPRLVGTAAATREPALAAAGPAPLVAAPAPGMAVPVAVPAPAEGKPALMVVAEVPANPGAAPVPAAPPMPSATRATPPVPPPPAAVALAVPPRAAAPRVPLPNSERDAVLAPTATPAPLVAPSPVPPAAERPPSSLSSPIAPTPPGPDSLPVVTSDTFGQVRIGVEGDAADLRVSLAVSGGAPALLAAEAPRLAADLAANGIRLQSLDVGSFAGGAGGSLAGGGGQQRPAGQQAPQAPTAGFAAPVPPSRPAAADRYA
jgi:hypothetical protein